MLRLLDIPGVPQVEARLELLPSASPTSDPVTRDRISGIISFLGLKENWWGDVDVEAANDDRYIDDIPEVGLAEWWRKRGWDITRDDGSVCRCYSFLETALMYVERGVGGSSKMRAEAAIWREKRRSQQGPDPRQRRQDQAFLALGTQRRSRA